MRDPNLLKQNLTDFILEDWELTIDAIDVVDAQSLLNPTENKPWLVALAIFVEGVRLIDNCVLK
ncbi:MAG: hypothetical protein IPJ69_10375 [Deltaproteobacteria bacterium]|nr:MAG: hypothetical protein IPJ69_10375 [Deltaproteobacteria bacterium]